MNQLEIQDVQTIEAVTTADHSTVTTGSSQVTPEQIQQYLRMLANQEKAKHNAQCRKKGFTGHIHQAAGNKLIRKLNRQGSLYARPSTVGQTFLDMQTAKFKASKVTV
jgi:hypothetical protein